MQGSNVYAENYTFYISKDSLSKVLSKFSMPNANGDSIFTVSQGNPYLLQGSILDSSTNNIYHVAIPGGNYFEVPCHLSLVSIEVWDKKSGTRQLFIVNKKDEDEKDREDRKFVVSNFKKHVLDKLNINFTK